MSTAINKAHIFDIELLLKDAALVAASAAAEVASVAKILDLGIGFWEGDLVLIFNAIEFDTADEEYDIVFQLSTSATFASVIFNKVLVQKGNARSGGDQDQIALGKEVIPVNNKVGAVNYQYARLYTVVAGTIVTGVNYEGFLTKS